MEMLIDFCYTSKITVDEKNVQKLLEAACLLQVSNYLKTYKLTLTLYNLIILIKAT